MPLIKVSVSGVLPAGVGEATALELSGICAATLGKPESYVQVIVADGVAACFGGKAGDSAFVDVRGIGGLTAEANRKLSARVCACLKAKTGVSPSRTYINFTDVPAANWGWDGATFG